MCQVTNKIQTNKIIKIGKIVLVKARPSFFKFSDNIVVISVFNFKEELYNFIKTILIKTLV